MHKKKSLTLHTRSNIKSFNYFRPPLSLSFYNLDVLLCQFAAALNVEGRGLNFYDICLRHFFPNCRSLLDMCEIELSTGVCPGTPIPLREDRNSLYRELDSVMIGEFFSFLCVLVSELPPPPPKIGVPGELTLAPSLLFTFSPHSPHSLHSPYSPTPQPPN